MAGLLAAHMLRRHHPVIHEIQSSLPNNHHALLRFRSDAVSRATGILFRRVMVTKAVYNHRTGELNASALPDLANMYARKVTGEVRARSVMNLETVERWIAPPDFISLLAHGSHIQFNSPLLSVEGLVGEPTISTIPMNLLMNVTGWPKPINGFPHQTITTMTVEIDAPFIDVYQTIYFPGDYNFYRASFTGSMLHIEYMGTPAFDDISQAQEIKWVMRHFGVSSPYAYSSVTVSTQAYGKLSPIPETERRAFILAMTDRFNVYSLGRFATWRQILLDDVVHDVQVIDRFINERDDYARALTTRGV